jgi:hypothetical protein
MGKKKKTKKMIKNIKKGQKTKITKKIKESLIPKYICGDCRSTIYINAIHKHTLRCRNSTYCCTSCSRTFTEKSVKIPHDCDGKNWQNDTKQNPSLPLEPKKPEEPNILLEQIKNTHPNPPEAATKQNLIPSKNEDSNPELSSEDSNPEPSSEDSNPESSSESTSSQENKNIKTSFKQMNSNNTGQPTEENDPMVMEDTELRTPQIYKGYIKWQNYDWENQTKRLIDSKGGSINQLELKNFVMEDILSGLRSQAEEFFLDRFVKDTALILEKKKL